MYDYIIGKISELKSNAIVVDNNNIGYLIYVANPYSYTVGEEYKVYIYQQVKEDENNLFGFKSSIEKDLFLQLISVKGLGCKMALPMLSTGDVNNILGAIDSGNIDYLKKFPKIGEKLARQIVLDLKGKLALDDMNKTNSNQELKEALIALGYKEKEITNVISKVDSDKKIEEQIKEALKLLLR